MKYVLLSVMNVNFFDLKHASSPDMQLLLPLAQAHHRWCRLQSLHRDGVQQILDERTVSSFDLIVSDMAPDTTGQKSIDAMKSV